MKRCVKRFSLAYGVGENDTQKTIGRLSVATTRHETTNAAKAMNNACDNGYDIKHRQNWNFVSLEKP